MIDSTREPRTVAARTRMPARRSCPGRSRHRTRAGVVTALLLATLPTGAAVPAVPPDADLREVELATVGWDMITHAPIVLLREPESGKVVPIWVGIAEAQAIARALHQIEMPRPMTHDLLADVVRRLGAEVEEVLVHDLKEGTYYGMVRLRVGPQHERIEIDSRPSDALALALRTSAPIRVARKILVDAPEFEFLAPEGPEQVVKALGITVVSVTEALREQFGLPERDGVVVTSVAGEAEKQGLRRGDLIVRVNDVVPTKPMEFFDAVLKTPRGRPVRITYWREGAEHEVSLPVEVPRTRPSRQAPQFRV